MGSNSESIRPHAVFVPVPLQGHINPMFKLAKLLHRKGFHITLANTEYVHKRLLKSRGPNSIDGLPEIPDGLPPSDSDASQDIPSLMDSMSFTLDAAEEFGNPIVLFLTHNAIGFLGYMQFPHLVERGLVPLKAAANSSFSSKSIIATNHFSNNETIPTSSSSSSSMATRAVYRVSLTARRRRRPRQRRLEKIESKIKTDSDRKTEYSVNANTNTNAIEVQLDSVVKIFTVSTSPNYILPWQNKSQNESIGSGFVIPGKKILTNAHVVADHTFVLVRKHGSPTKYRAEVQAVGHECDLGILVVESEEFWEGMNFLELGDIPFLQQAVSVAGYPQGGDNISVTKGVVSRVEITQYAHASTQLLAIQIDAAINPGNSGGPAIMGNKVVGVAFQNLSGAENIGYIIPVPVIKHFLGGVEESGKYVGFCSLGLSYQLTENVQLRNHFKMRPEMTGVLVSKIDPLSDAYKILKKDDIILSFDGVPIANDGTVPFRNRERITFDYLESMKKPNQTAVLKVLRDGKEYEFSITLQPLQPLVPVHQFDKLPSYYIFGGLVFVPLTRPFLQEYGEDWYNNSPRRLCESALTKSPKKAGEQFVILSQVLMDDINAGYERLAESQVKKVNGVTIENLKHLCQLVENCSEESVRFDLDCEKVVVLNYQLAKIATSKILKNHKIPSVISSDLIDQQNSSELHELASS